MADLFACSNRKGPIARGKTAPVAIADLKSPLAHRCFRCGCFTPLGLRKKAGEIVWACAEHFGALR
jgi:hypothetical protein